MKLRVLITGSTGMVGGAALLECLESDAVERVLVINRRPLGRTHPKLTEVLHADFTDWTPIREALRGYHACFHRVEASGRF